VARSESEKALEYVTAREAETNKPLVKGPCITVSRESGAGSGLVDEILKSYLERHQIENTSRWAIFDKNLIGRVLEDHNLPDRLAKLMSHEKISAFTVMINELLGLQPSMRTLLHKTSQTILQLTEIGNVIVVGRAGNIITSKMRNSFHVRLVAPFDNRVKRIQEFYHFNKKEAAEWVKNEDNSRKEYFIKNFHTDIDNPLNYHIILNTGLLSYEECAHTIGRMVMERFPETFKEIQIAEPM